MSNHRKIEDIATELLQADAKLNGTTLYRMGIIDTRRRYMINKREIQISRFEKRRDQD